MEVISSRLEDNKQAIIAQAIPHKEQVVQDSIKEDIPQLQEVDRIHHIVMTVGMLVIVIKGIMATTVANNLAARVITDSQAILAIAITKEFVKQVKHG